MGPLSLRILACLLALHLGAAAGPASAEPACPARLAAATRLLLVVAQDMDAHTAVARMYERGSADASWARVGRPKPVVLGRHGLGWSWDQASLGAHDQPRKREGDGRTPAGVFGIDHAFGFAPQGPGQHYLQLRAGNNFCVDDPHSPSYNKIVAMSTLPGGTSGEDMGTIALYRRGLLIAFPTSREEKGGSCIFIHVWRGRSSPTSGCIALSEGDVAQIQEWASDERALVAILPKEALTRLPECFPKL